MKATPAYNNVGWKGLYVKYTSRLGIEEIPLYVPIIKAVRVILYTFDSPK